MGCINKERMENNSQYVELLTRYLVNEVNAEEKVFVEDWIAASKENQYYFESLQNAWRLTTAKQTLDYVLDEMKVDEKWDRFLQNIETKETKFVYGNAREQSEDEFPQEEMQSRKPVVYRILMATAIAASVLLIIGLGWKFFAGNKEEKSLARNTEKKFDSTTYVLRHEVNTTGKEKRIKLPDGSLVVLADKSEIIYREPFTDKRDITLIGKAFFKVAKDRTKPFTVTSQEISTTALGTGFTVTTFSDKSQIIVRLYEGKVVIKAVDKNNGKLKEDVYLSPGQAFVYDVQTTAKVSTFKLNNAAVPEEIMSEEVLRDNPSLPDNAETPYFMFNNQSLSEVFDLLSKMYQVTIVYNKKDVHNLYFIRKYNSTENIDNILKEIATLNNLSLRKNNDTFVISK